MFVTFKHKIYIHLCQKWTETDKVYRVYAFLFDICSTSPKFFRQSSLPQEDVVCSSQALDHLLMGFEDLLPPYANPLGESTYIVIFFLQVQVPLLPQLTRAIYSHSVQYTVILFVSLPCAW